MDKFIESELEGFCDKSPTLNNMLHMPENLNEDVVLKESITDTIMKSVKKTIHTLLLVIPPDMYETISQDSDILNSYISQQLAPWHEDTLVDPYVVLNKEEATKEYEENKEDYPDINEYYMKYHGGHLTESGEVVSQINENGIYSTYVIEKCGLEVGEIMNMILSEEINFKYIIHNGVLCDKENSESANALSESDPNSYFAVITVSD